MGEIWWLRGFFKKWGTRKEILYYYWRAHHEEQERFRQEIFAEEKAFAEVVMNNCMEHPMISVIIPIYNAEKTLQRCLDSVITQTYQNLEIILINDGSTDSSLDTCILFAERDSRIKVIDSQNQGVSKARNLGMDTANGEYFGFVDSDDWIEPEFFETLCNGYMMGNNSSLSVVGVATDSWKQYLNILCNNKNHCILSYEKAIDEITKTHGLRGYLWNKLFHKTDIRLNESISVCEDLEFVIRYLSFFKAKPNGVVVQNCCLYHYYLNNLAPSSDCLRYGFLRQQTAYLAYNEILENLPDGMDFLHDRIKFYIFRLSYTLLVAWYFIPKNERDDDKFEQYKIKMVQDNFNQYYRYNKYETSIKWRSKFLLMKVFPVIMPKLLFINQS